MLGVSYYYKPTELAHLHSSAVCVHFRTTCLYVLQVFADKNKVDNFTDLLDDILLYFFIYFWSFLQLTDERCVSG